MAGSQYLPISSGCLDQIAHYDFKVRDSWSPRISVLISVSEDTSRLLYSALHIYVHYTIAEGESHQAAPPVKRGYSSVFCSRWTRVPTAWKIWPAMVPQSTAKTLPDLFRGTT